MASSKKESVSGFTEDWLPVKSIQNNMIITKDNQKVTTVALVEKENESEENNEVVSEEIKVDAEITVDDKLENR